MPARFIARIFKKGNWKFDGGIKKGELPREFAFFIKPSYILFHKLLNKSMKKVKNIS